VLSHSPFTSHLYIDSHYCFHLYLGKILFLNGKRHSRYIVTHIINPKLIKRELQVIQGTILGGSSIVKPTGGKNCYLSMRSKNQKWLTYKAAELSAVSSHNPITIEKTNRWHSLCYPLFNEMRQSFYDKKERKLTVENLDGLNLSPVAFMIWFGDVGTYNSENVVLNTHIWGEAGSKTIVEYFSLLNFKAETILERKNYRTMLDKDSSAAFMKMIGPLLPHFFFQSLNTAHQ